MDTFLALVPLIAEELGNAAASCRAGPPAARHRLGRGAVQCLFSNQPDGSPSRAVCISLEKAHGPDQFAI